MSLGGATRIRVRRRCPGLAECANAGCRGRSHPRHSNVTVHDLRHTAASLAISSGANVKAVQRMLGHASDAMTLDTYADLFDDDLDTVAFALDEAQNRADVGGMWAQDARKPMNPAENRGIKGWHCFPAWTRTKNLSVNSRLLCQLSYRGMCPPERATRKA